MGAMRIKQEFGREDRIGGPTGEEAAYPEQRRPHDPAPPPPPSPISFGLIPAAVALVVLALLIITILVLRA